MIRKTRPKNPFEILNSSDNWWSAYQGSAVYNCLQFKHHGRLLRKCYAKSEPLLQSRNWPDVIE